MYDEAECLDERRHRDWLALLTDDVRYRMPVRVTSAAHASTTACCEDMAHFDEDSYSLRKRVERFETDHAWAEDPPSRTRRHVTQRPRAGRRGRGELVVALATCCCSAAAATSTRPISLGRPDRPCCGASPAA